ncbi:cupin domain-containing protein [Streptomyces sp. AM 4-1-1]|uniref:cupin domain-containing protein n=1 Tax=Streptomyces sp. AM 4-1-1 TaxID=3028710 RepID=UPI0023B95BAB|nr:cupin domain-containing protein [Streptomyces sp. AM 4-1-1]WEH36700.1 cupin domain-containing protein [Streptomyces sp. AM 4-1-1]
MTTASTRTTRLWGQGSVLTTELTAAQTGGVLGVTRFEAVCGERGPRHVHSLEDELFIVGDGELVITVGERTQGISGAGALFLPRGVPHSYEVLSRTATFRVVTTPGGFERFFMVAGFPVGGDEQPPTGARWSVQRTKEVAERLGLGLTWCE